MVHKRQIAFLLVALLGATILVLNLSPAASWGQQSTIGETVDHGPSGAPYASGELLVTYEPGASSDAIGSVRGTAGMKVVSRLPDLDTQLIEFPRLEGDIAQGVGEEALAEVKANLERVPAVESVQYNHVRRLSVIPNDPRFGGQYGLRLPGFPTAWDTTLGNGVKVAVVDTGIAAGHPDLRGKVVAQGNFADQFGGARGRVGHGTHVAGVIGAQTGNGVGVAGGCPNCRLLSARVDGFLFGRITDASVAEGINWSVNNGARVINLSLGSPQPSAILENAVDRATSRGVVVVAAAGNEGTSTKFYPAAYENVIAVAATSRRDGRAGFSNFGNWVDVAAPGVGILSTYPGGYASLSGTSFSSPHVAALAGLLSSQGYTRAEITSRILATAEDEGPLGRDPFYGEGRIDAAAAVGP